MDPNSLSVIQGTAGQAVGDPVYVEDVFSTYLYEGTNNTNAINNGIDLSGEGGLVWIKVRDTSDHHLLYDTERGATKQLIANRDDDESTESRFSSFNSDGFTVATNDNEINQSAYDYASWTFRKQKKFFDIVTWTGNDGGDRTLSHNLGSVPGCVMVKRTDGTMDWGVYHHEVGTALADGGELNTNFKFGESGNINPIRSIPTSTQMEIRGGTNEYNTQGETYVAYLFGHNEAVFGENRDEVIIKCGKYTGNSSTTDGTTINCGFEPQWVLHKGASDTSNWLLWDTMRGFNAQGDFVVELRTNENDGETERNSGPLAEVYNRGFKAVGNWDDTNYLNRDYIYIAIRRGPMKLFDGAATEVFGVDASYSGVSNPCFRPGFLCDSAWAFRRASGTYFGDGVGIWSRLTGKNFLETGSDDVQQNAEFGGDNHIGWHTSTSAGDISYTFKRVPGFFDVVAYDGNGSPRSIYHALGVTPEMMIVKKRNYDQGWWVYHKDADSPSAATAGERSRGSLNTNSLFVGEDPNNPSNESNDWSNIVPNSIYFYVNNNTNDNNSTYIAYLFASLDGISKVGHYDGTGNTVSVNCGFSAGARFVLVKRINATGNWYVWDTERGIVSGNDPYRILNGTDADQTTDDYIDPYNPGFQITSSAPAGLNESGGKYIYLAFA